MTTTDTQKEFSPDGIKFYQLNWKTQKVSLAEGKFVFELAKPGDEKLLERDLELPSEISLGRDKSYALNAGSAEQDKIDAKYCDVFIVGEAPVGAVRIRAAAFRALYLRTIELAPNATAFDDVVEIHEIIGDPDQPHALIKHFIKQPEEADLTKITAAINNTRLAPDKNAKQKLITKSSLAKAIAFYNKQLDKIGDAYLLKAKPESEISEYSSVNQPDNTKSENDFERVFFKPEFKQEFLDEVDALIKEMIVTKFVNEANKLLGD